jgi:Fe-S cluster biogenesis protein NfuA
LGRTKDAERNKIMNIDEIKNIVEENVNPVLSEHYGGAEVTGWKDGVVSIKMTGACGRCAAAQDTIESVVKGIVMSNAPDVKDVILDTSVPQDMVDFAKKILNKEI